MNDLPTNLKRKVVSKISDPKNLASLAQVTKNWKGVVTANKKYKVAKAKTVASKNAQHLENRGHLVKSAKRHMNLDIVTALHEAADPTALLKEWSALKSTSYERQTNIRKRKIAKAALKNKKRNALNAALARMKLT